MRRFKNLLVAGISSAAIIGFTGLARAESPTVHTMTVQLPGGGVETIRYTGDVAPKIVVGPPAAAAMPAMSTFVAFDQIAAQMDRQMAMMMQQARAMQMMPMMGMPNMNQLMQAAARNGGSGFCAQSMSVTSTGNGPAKVVTHSVGNCGGGAPATNGGNQANNVQAAPDPAKPIPIKTTAPLPHPVRSHI